MQLFAADFRHRFVELLAGPFKDMPVALALAIASAGVKAPQEQTSLPPLDAKTVSGMIPHA